MNSELTLEQVIAQVIGEMEREAETEALADGIVPESVLAIDPDNELWWAWERRVMARYGMKGRPAWASKPGEVH